MKFPTFHERNHFLMLGFWVSISDVGSINIKRFEYSSNLVIKEVGIKKKIPSIWNENKILICCPLLQFLNCHPSICNIASNHYLCKKIGAICVTIVIFPNIKPILCTFWLHRHKLQSYLSLIITFENFPNCSFCKYV
jgi:hypothetical protein